MARKFTKIAQDAFESMQIEAGCVLNKLDVSGTQEVQDADFVCSTSGGIEVSCKPTFTNFFDDVDNAPDNAIEGLEITGWDCTMAFTTNEANIATIKLALGVATNTGNKIAPGFDGIKEAVKDIWWAGDRKDGGWVACCLKNALSKEGLTLKTTKKGKGQISCTLTGHVTLADPRTCPMEFYVEEGSAPAEANVQEGDEE